MRKDDMSERVRRACGGTDRERVDAMTEEEREAAARADPDNPPMTDEEISRLRRPPLVRRLRCRLGLSQRGFSRRFGCAHFPRSRTGSRQRRGQPAKRFTISSTCPLSQSPAAVCVGHLFGGSG